MSIVIEHVTKRYRGGVTALQDITLEIETGMFGLVGPNGAGKTTLMRILAGLIRPSQGRVSVFGHDLSSGAGRAAARRVLGYLPQELGLYPNLNAREFLDYMGILKGIVDSQARRAQIDDLLDKVRLTDVAHRRLKTYSGGMKRRVGIAQALLGDPRLVIVDEPTAGLDPEERVRLRNLLSEMATERAVLLSTHVVEDISHSCRSLAAIRAGQLVFLGEPAELIARARGHVWSVMMHNGDRPDPAWIVASTLQLQAGTQYRILGDPDARLQAAPLEPSLEDGYLWLMREAQVSERPVTLSTG